MQLRVIAILCVLLCFPPVFGYELDLTGLTGGSAAYGGVGEHPDSFWYPLIPPSDADDENLTLINVSPYQQTTEISAGAASALVNLRYYGFDGDEMSIAQEMGTIPYYGTNVVNMARWFTDKGWTVSSSTTGQDGDLAMLRENLQDGIPTLVAWSDWGGTWMVVCGYDTLGTETELDDVIIFADPYDVTDHHQDGYYTYPASRFLSMWFVPRWYPDKDAVRPWLTATPP